MNDFFHKFSAPFIKSAKETFKVMLSTEISMQSPKIKTTNLGQGDLTALIGLSGVIDTPEGPKQFMGLLALSFKEDVYVKLASRMLGEEYLKFVPDIADVGSEIANIILGSSKSALSEIGVKLGMTSPSTIRGKHFEINYPKDSIVIETLVTCDLGDFYLDLCCQNINV